MRARVFSALAFFVFLLVLPIGVSSSVRTSVYPYLKWPLAASKSAAQLLVQLVHFRGNAEDNVFLRSKLAQRRFQEVQYEELRRENARLLKLLNMKSAVPPTLRRSVAALVIGRSPLAWHKTFLLDKGTDDALTPNLLVLANLSLVGKTVECGAAVSSAMLITDPNFKIGVILQRTRQQGLLYGTGSSARVKYLSVDADVKPGDLVETAGAAGFFPKAIPVGQVQRVWKEPGQIYQVAQILPFVQLSRVDEVICVE